ncbi:hypothetical protein G3T36_17020 [Diaminobutyricibacter tongyongensis]|uniref:Activator of Hsp90 ATPase homologue 1/2-like C-terminal domain-containing protein n=1 Tax=Leifsonia tongyongensis TaxID=1268043 RepID=A0A6L9Y1X1_9MICO|nr:SRPBCC domain-containing protein [Diaminobutyricibacter tongyongensis]NEN07566.1 hypothetical protein [Diaminobutyricibacter tongyongensis]
MTIFGDIALDGARRSVTVEREYATTAADLWSALTEPGRIARWIGNYTTEADGYRLQLGGGFPDVTGRVLACEPEKRFVLLWLFAGEAETELEATLAPHGEDHVVLTLAHRRVQAINASVYGALWQAAFTHLDGELTGEQALGDRGYLGEAVDASAFDAALEEYRRREAALTPARMIRQDGRSGVQLERVLDAPIDQVWDALTGPERIGRWLWPVVEWPDDPARSRPLELGDTFLLGDANVPDGVHTMEVLALEPGRLLSFTWGPARSAVTLSLSEEVDGTLLVLDQDPIPDVFGAGRLRSAPDFAAGWHSLVDGLTLLLEGLDAPKREGLWEAAYDVYAAEDAAE